MSQTRILAALKGIQRQNAKILRILDPGEENITVKKACELCLAAKFAKGVRPESLDAARKSFKDLCAAIGEMSIQGVLPRHIAAWLADHDGRDKEHSLWGQKTKLNNHKYANSLFAWLVKSWKLKRNPVDGVPTPIVPFKKITILTVEQIQKLMSAVEQSDPALIGYIAPILFGGLRPTESMRSLGEYFVNGMIDLGGEICKLKDRRCVKMSDQLSKWMNVPGVVIGHQKNLLARMKAVSDMAGVPLPKNVLRHCFCSYSLPIYGVDETARRANNSPSKLHSNYLALTTKEDAEAFFKIMPSNETKL